MTAMRQEPDLVQVIEQDHREFERAFAELERGSQSPQFRRQLLDHLIADVTRHTVAKEQFLYPTARDKVDGSAQLVEHEVAQSEKAERLMKELEDVEPTDPKFEELSGQLIRSLRKQFDDEERKLLPQLRTACTPKELQTLGHSVELAKQVAPTRPHPAAPDRPPANLIIDPAVSIVDKVRDVLTDRKV